MPPRRVPTARQRRLGGELRKMREHAGVSIADAGKELGTDRTRISNMEAGRFGVSEERIRALANIYACPDSAYIDALISMAEDRTRGWWEDSREILPANLLDLAELEHHATSLTIVNVVYVPGLLQTEDYADSLFRLSAPERPARDIQRFVSFRMRRKCIMEREHPTPCTFVIHEAALRMRYGDPDIQRRQLNRINDLGDMDGISVHVIPFEAGGFPGANGSLTFAYGSVPQLDTVQVDAVHSSVLVDAETHLENYRRILRRTVKASLPSEASREFIQKLAREL
ncbi:Scr1 family TA system antitoxin-like transcriptional regulator [Streptomyces sp. YGL11-2]|uniref:Scr1 family TA system antitoxin-like transcriptional regulator n=1 Tax=Streptomyces sp. YGL11-2 TaxID=3414028 RepID=UPI003CED45D3